MLVNSSVAVVPVIVDPSTVLVEDSRTVVETSIALLESESMALVVRSVRVVSLVKASLVELASVSPTVPSVELLCHVEERDSVEVSSSDDVTSRAV